MIYKGIGINQKIATSIFCLGCIATIGLILACAPPAKVIRPVPTSSWNNNFSFSYDTPIRETHAPVGVTVAIVNPNYREKDSVLNTPTLLRVGSGFSKSMATDMDRVLISKGLTVTGPFPEFEEMTYPEKKGSDLALTPRVILTAEVQADPWQLTSNKTVLQRTFKANFSGFVVFELREPLSNEKLWVKKLELDSVVEEGEEDFQAVPARFETREGLLGTYQEAVAYNPGASIYDGQVEATANALKKMYPIIMEKFAKYINTEELLTLKAKGKEIRDLKKY